MKKMLSLALALVMALALCIPAFADTTTGEPATTPTTTTKSITITNAVEGQTYNAYKIFDVTYIGTNFAYTINAKNGTADNPWFNIVKDYKVDGTAVFTLNQSQTDKNVYAVDHSKFTTDSQAKAFAEYLSAELAKANATTTTITADGTNTVNTGGSTAKIDNLTKDGYYFVTSTVGTLCMLDTNNPTVEIQDKNEETTILKEVKEGETYKGWNDGNIGDTVNFKVTVNVAAGAINYVVHDTMDTGLTFDTDSIVVKYIAKDTTTETDVNNTNNDKYTLTTENIGTETFQLAFKNDYLATLNVGDKLVVYYSATINDQVLTKETADNKVVLMYGDNNNITTGPTTTTTHVWKFGVFKHDKENVALANATFAVTTAETYSENNALTFNGTNNVYKYDKSGTVKSFTTDNTGKFVLTGLDAGTYYLWELQAPDGYNKIAGSIKVEIEAKENNGVVTSTVKVNGTEQSADNDGIVYAKVLNQTGPELPSTGGIGTTIFYTLGGLLMAGAVVLLITKKKMAGEE